MSELVKIVNVYSKGATFSLTNRPFTGTLKRTRMTVSQIKECLYAKMRVEEVIGNRIIPLDFSNYATDNSAPAVTKVTREAEPEVISLDKNGNPIKQNSNNQKKKTISNQKEYVVNKKEEFSINAVSKKDEDKK